MEIPCRRDKVHQLSEAMTMGQQLEVVIASPPDRARLVAEIWLGQNMIAEISQEGPEMVVEVYSSGSMKLGLARFIAALEDAQSRLR